MTSRPRGTSSTGKNGDTASPARKPEVADPGTPGYEPTHILQILIQLQKDVAAGGAKVDRLIDDVRDLNAEVAAQGKILDRVQGGGVAAAVLVTLFAGFVWWLIGGQINDLRNQLYRNHVEESSQLKPNGSSSNKSPTGPAE